MLIFSDNVNVTQDNIFCNCFLQKNCRKTSQFCSSFIYLIILFASAEDQLEREKQHLEDEFDQFVDHDAQKDNTENFSQQFKDFHLDFPP